MSPGDIKSLVDVENWLRNHVEWSDSASEDCAAAAIDVLVALQKAFDRLVAQLQK